MWLFCWIWECQRKFKKYKFFNNDINKFILLLRKGVYPYECTYQCWTFNETLLPEKEKFYSNLNMDDITDTDWCYMHAKRVCKDFEMKKIGEYHDLYLQNDTRLLAENVRELCLKIYHLDPAKFII